MENFTKTYNDFKNLSKKLQHAFILKLLNDDIISFNKISELYVKYLENLKKKAHSKECMFANCLGSYLSGWKETNEPFFQSMAYILLKSREPRGFLKKYLKKKNEKDIKKINELMNSEGYIG